MAYRTIAQKAQAEANRSTHPTCICDVHLRPSNTYYYINQFGEHVPLCSECAKIVCTDIPVFKAIFKLANQK